MVVESESLALSNFGGALFPSVSHKDERKREVTQHDEFAREKALLASIRLPSRLSARGTDICQASLRRSTTPIVSSQRGSSVDFSCQKSFYRAGDQTRKLYHTQLLWQKAWDKSSKTSNEAESNVRRLSVLVLVPLIHDDFHQHCKAFDFFLHHKTRKLDAASHINRNVHPERENFCHPVSIVDIVL